jgi:hypothetical protein
VLFEKLSINCQIGVKTNLPKKYNKIIILLLFMLYSKNYYMIQEMSHVVLVIEESDLDYTTDGFEEIFTKLSNGDMNNINLNIVIKQKMWKNKYKKK